MRVSLSLICGTQGRKGGQVSASGIGDTSGSPRDAKCHLLRWPRGSSRGPALLLFRSAHSERFFGENTEKTEPARSRRHRQTRARTDGSGVARHTDGHTDRPWYCPAAPCPAGAGTALRVNPGCWGGGRKLALGTAVSLFPGTAPLPGTDPMVLTAPRGQDCPQPVVAEIPRWQVTKPLKSPALELHPAHPRAPRPEQDIPGKPLAP